MALLVVVFIAFGFFGVGSLVDARAAYKRSRQFMRMPTVPVAALDVGHFAVEGEIVVIRDRLRSPLTIQECVFFKFSALDFMFAGKRTKPKLIASDSRWVIFGVRDDTGVVQVDLENVKPLCSLPVRVNDHKLPDEARQSVAVAYGASGPFVSYCESTLRLGEHVYVCGDVNQTAHGELRFSAAMRSNRRLRVSACGKEALLGDADLTWKGLLVLGIGELLVSFAAACSIAVVWIYKLPLP